MGIRGVGESPSVAFEQAALALTAVIADPDRVAPRSEVEVKCEAPEDSLLLVDWLNAIIYEMATRGMLFGRFQVQTRGGHLHARMWGEPIRRCHHRPAVEVKGATYTDLHVGRDATGQWVAQCVVDV